MTKYFRKHKGKEVDLGGTVLTFAPLTLGMVQNLPEVMQVINNGNDIEKQIEATIELAFNSLKRNYDDITIEEVKDLITLDDIQIVIEAIMKSSGFKDEKKTDFDEKKT